MPSNRLQRTGLPPAAEPERSGLLGPACRRFEAPHERLVGLDASAEEGWWGRRESPERSLCSIVHAVC
jgi:hypothetical protein